METPIDRKRDTEGAQENLKNRQNSQPEDTTIDQ